jgi:hypothetical protein
MIRIVASKYDRFRLAVVLVDAEELPGLAHMALAPDSTEKITFHEETLNG